MLPLCAVVAGGGLPKFTRIVLSLVLLAGAAAAQNPSGPDPAGGVIADPGIKDASKFDAKRPLARELETNVPDGFTLVTVGDCIISRPLLQYAARDEGFRKVVEILKRAEDRKSVV